MKITLVSLLAVVLLAVTSLAASNTIFALKGINLSVNPHMAPAGTAEKCIDWVFTDVGVISKREGYAFKDRNIGNIYSSLFSYMNDDGKQRLVGIAEDVGTNNYQSIYVSPIRLYNISTTSIYDYIYRDTLSTASAATYNGVLIIANGKNRPMRYNGIDVQPLVPVAPGSFDFAPEKPEYNTKAVLDGKYYYGWQAAIPDSVDDPGVKSDSLFLWHPDSLNLDGPSWQVKTDSDWVRIFNRPFAGITRPSEQDSTIIRLCRTRADVESSDSMFLLDIIRLENVWSLWSLLDSLPDDSFGVTEFWTDTSGAPVGYYDTTDCDPTCDSTRISHPFAGFIDTVTHNADTTSDSLYKIGQPQLLTILHNDHSKGISADDTLLGNVVFRRYQFQLLDTATGALSAPGPYLRVEQDTTAAGYPRDSLIRIITPSMDTAEPHWGILSRAEERVDSIITDTNYVFILPNNAGGVYYCDDGYDLVILQGEGFRCRKKVVTLDRDYTIVDPYYPVCTIKTFIHANSICDTIRDSTPNGVIILRGSIPQVQTIGQWDNVTVMEDRLFMSSGFKVHFNEFTASGSEMGSWPYGNEIAVGGGVDGDVTALHAGDNYLDIFTSNSWYRAKELDANTFSVFEIINKLGCISSNSVIDLPSGGLAFESYDGYYIFGSHWQSQYKSSGGNINRISDPIKVHLEGMLATERQGCFSWLTGDRRNLVFSYPILDTSYVFSLITGDWSQWTFAPRAVRQYDAERYYSMSIIVPDSGTVFITDSSDSIFTYGGDYDVGDSIEVTWKSKEMFQTGDYGKVTEFKLWRYSDVNDDGLDFNLYDLGDTVAATRRDTLDGVTRVKRKDIDCPESQGFKIEITSYADSIAIDKIDLRYLNTGPMPVD